MTRKALLKLVEQQGYRCALTGRKLEPENASLDHMIAMAKHGPNTMENVQIVCNHVNAAKGTMSNDEFIQMCREVVEWCDSESL